MGRLRKWLRYLIAMTAHYSGMDTLYRRVGGSGLVILMLHRIRNTQDPFPLSTTMASFSRIVGWLREGGMLVSLDQGLAELEQPDSRKLNFALTFDDGYYDNLRVLNPALAPVPAIIYIATSHIGGESLWVYRLIFAVEHRKHDVLDLGELGLGHFDLSDEGDRTRLYALLPERLKLLAPAEIEDWIGSIYSQTQADLPPSVQRDMLDWKDVHRLHDSGIGIGAHTCNHVLLSMVDDDTAREEIFDSARSIASKIGAFPPHFAYPNGGAGDFTERDMQLVREAGFKTAATSIEGVNRAGVDLFRLLRINVDEDRFQSPNGSFSKALFFSETCGLLSWLRDKRMA